MHSKVVDPAKDGSTVYDNTGSSFKAIKYSEHDAIERGETPEFFNGERSGFSAREVITHIDHNVKGLKKGEVKFHSLIISPSENELQLIGNNKESLKAYTKQIMENYAKNFKLKDGKRLSEKDLVWYAIIHEDRKYKSSDFKSEEVLSKKEKVKERELLQELKITKGSSEIANLNRKLTLLYKKAIKRNNMKLEIGNIKPGSLKPGLNTHIHIFVSRRDNEMKITLNPQGRKNKFSLKEWQSENGLSFQRMFGYEKETTFENLWKKSLSEKRVQRHIERIEERVDRINSYSFNKDILDKEKTLRMAYVRDYDKGFFMNLNRVENLLKDGKFVTDPYKMLGTNKDQKIEFTPNEIKLNGLVSFFKELEQVGADENEYSENLNIKKKLRRGKGNETQKENEMDIEI